MKLVLCWTDKFTTYPGSPSLSGVSRDGWKKVGPLRDVAVAAAGRALKTCRGKAVRAVNGSRLEADAVRGLELEALEQARRELAGDEESAGRYHCVGYSVVEYELDGTAIGNLLGQRGQEAGAEVIGTFLPKVVVESLAAALEAADLRMRALTLEPIAAIHALIPASMRKLNLALVDVGAGTSDIAVTAEGTVVAYGMVPSAGDEITEALAETWLLDFDTAETAKRSWRDPKYALPTSWVIAEKCRARNSFSLWPPPWTGCQNLLPGKF